MFLVEIELGIGQQHRQLRPRKRLRAPPALGDLHLVGQELDCAVELARGFQRLHQTLLEAEILEPAPLGKGEGPDPSRLLDWDAPLSQQPALLDAMRGMHERGRVYEAASSAKEIAALAQPSALRQLERTF